MCSNPAGFGGADGSEPYTYEFLVQKLQQLRKAFSVDNREVIGFTGGEPTIHPDFLKLISFTKTIFPKNQLVVVTNGRMFSYNGFAESCLPFIDNIKIALHGPDAALHDATTRVKGSFKQTIQGVKNILAINKSSNRSLFDVEIRVVLTKLNYLRIDETLRFIKDNFSNINRVVIIFPEFEGTCQDNFSIVGVLYVEVASIIQKTVHYWKKQFQELRLYHFPLCVLASDLWPYVWRTLRGEEVVFLDKCNKCQYKKYCLGVHRDYIKVAGEEEFNPINHHIVDIVVNGDKDEFLYQPITSIKP